ncbi:hypothetical protein Hanom_Chr15g01370251 [Helianthus anomalus]
MRLSSTPPNYSESIKRSQPRSKSDQIGQLGLKYICIPIILKNDYHFHGFCYNY